MVGGFGPRFSYKWTQQMPKFFSKVNVSGVYQKLAACLWLPPESVRIAEIVEAKGQDWIFAKTTAPLSSQYAPGINIDFGSSIFQSFQFFMIICQLSPLCQIRQEL